MWAALASLLLALGVLREPDQRLALVGADLLDLRDERHEGRDLLVGQVVIGDVRCLGHGGTRCHVSPEYVKGSRRRPRRGHTWDQEVTGGPRPAAVSSCDRGEEPPA